MLIVEMVLWLKRNERFVCPLMTSKCGVTVLKGPKRVEQKIERLRARQTEAKMATQRETKDDKGTGWCGGDMAAEQNRYKKNLPSRTFHFT